MATLEKQPSAETNSNLEHGNKLESLEEDSLTSEEVALLVKTKLNKASGYKPDFSKLPKPPEEEFVLPFHIKSKLAKNRKGSTPLVLEERIGPNITPEAAKKSQKATYNKMLARMCGRRRQQKQN